MAGSDPYAALLASPLGKRLAGSLGLPRPTELRRYVPGEPILDGAALVGGLPGGAESGPLAEAVEAVLRADGIEIGDPFDTTEVAAIVCDLADARQPADLERLRAVVAPSLKRLGPSGRVLVLGRHRGPDLDPTARAVQRALVGATKSIAKETRRGGTANLVLVGPGAEGAVESTVRFLLSGRAAYVSGQVVSVGAVAAGDVAVPFEPVDWTQPLADRVAVVTGAARGIGAAVAEVLSRDGATVVCVDVPAAGEALVRTANRVGGTALQVDVTANDAGRRIAEHAHARHGGLDIVVHNAGITRDKLLANTDEARWAQVIEVNLAAVLRMNEVLLAPGGLGDGGRMVLVSSLAGVAGNRGQVSYAASKAGLAGLAEALGGDPDLRARGITVNAVAPGFIETEMTARIPLATRELGRRLNSLQQGGLPVDVAETIAWLAQPGSGGVTGQVVRVCGQSLLGA
ncbi:MAG TPA: 3-oxoacyl-ACP reductase [Dermatophilaceae bacterium]|nr:3-oxoacyl-ACP reductase [Dermatophilaceae bacterium]